MEASTCTYIPSGHVGLHPVLLFHPHDGQECVVLAVFCSKNYIVMLYSFHTLVYLNHTSGEAFLLIHLGISLNCLE